MPETSLKDNLKLIRQVIGFTQQEFADYLQIPVTKIQNYERGKGTPDYLTLTRLTVLTGIGENELINKKLYESQLNIPKSIREAKNQKSMIRQDNDFKYAVDEKIMTDNMLIHEKRTPGTFAKIPEPATMVPFLRPSEFTKYVNDESYRRVVRHRQVYPLPPTINPEGAIWRYYEIPGDSMEPTFYSGDIVLTTQVPQIDWNQIPDAALCVFVSNAEIVFKRFGGIVYNSFVILSDNIKYESYRLNFNDCREVWLYRSHATFTAPPPPNGVTSINKSAIKQIAKDIKEI